ncbi:AAA family ATPase [Rhodospirillaceae bacterium KN72]|uniref:AAA family ATPase n=1 Tax=Pacificispira spongiicola TaxID=2729598 RepID=A0A7Y0DYF8_9PROT|nr:AAA family ATPase [Pacificispira spongiicola]NMM43901.1 AAA family ATPase [Pacificispira spongiicola]
MADEIYIEGLAEALGEFFVEAPATTKTIWDELNDWGLTLASWQRFIVSHAVRDGTLTDERVNEAYRLFQRDNKLDAGDEELPDIPASVTGRAAVAGVSSLVLQEMRALKNVNAIPETSSLTFGAGLTVVYGHNGAGKSGFARMLSSACFSRSDPTIIHNIYDNKAPDTPATAEFLIEKGTGKSEAIAFTVGDEDSDLQRISVFDSSVARVHLAKESELGFQPAGFDVFDELMRVVGLIIEKLDADIASRTKPNKFDQLFADSGPIADQLAKLTSKSDIAALRTLSVFGQAEQERLDEVARQEKELLAKSPVETLKALATAKVDIAALQKKMDEICGSLGDEASVKARTMLGEHRAATAGAIKVGAETVSHPNLTKTGTDEWDAFVEASRTLGQAESDTYPAEGDPCLLCHRPLDEPSATLIKRMWGYLDADARKAAVSADEKINAYLNELRALKLTLLPADSRARSELAKINPDLVATFDGVSATFAARREVLVGALDAGQADHLPAGNLTLPDAEIANSVAEIHAQETALKDGKFDEMLANLKSEHITLRQRQVLGKNIEDVAAFVEGLAWIEMAGKAKPNPRFVTEKQKGLFQTLIEGAYKARLEEECAKLECALPIEFKARGSAGKTLRGLKVQGGHKPEDIFSEGEQRALALADFLTEVNLNPASAAIIFDDPVTSLDHMRKKRIARRLVEESAIRQVIVFSHDIVFVTMLTELTKSQDGISADVHWIERDYSGNPGAVKLNDSPANHKSYLSVHKASECLAKAKKSAGQERVDLIEKGADALRRTIEETIIHELLNGTVVRWEEHIRVNNLRQIFWTDEIAEALRNLHGDVSRLIGGHSHSDEYTGGTLDPDDLEALIERVKTTKQAISDGKKSKK